MKIISIKKSQDFKIIGKKGSKFYSKTLILLSSPTPTEYSYNPSKGKNSQDFCRVGYTVSKSVDKSAVVRNLAKRRLRQAIKELVSLAKNHCDYIMIARKEIGAADYSTIISDLRFCLTRIHNSKNHETSGSKQKK